MQSIYIKYHTQLKNISIPLASSKSESNRALLIHKLTGDNSILNNLSVARDTQIMRTLLASNDIVLDVKDAGTVMRFMTAYLALCPERKVITGTDRMQLRPIKILVEALNEIGANIQYKNKKGYPPLNISGLTYQKTNKINIAANISSQYISALMMIAPLLPKGLEISLQDDIYSLPYINMTLGLMQHFGIKYTFEKRTISISGQSYKPAIYTIESDWSSASYWYSFVALAEYGKIKLLGLKKKSLQGDQVIIEIMDKLGVKSEFKSDGVVLSKKSNDSELVYDFRNCPDLAQTIIVAAVAKKVKLKMVGLESLKIKETDRIAAISKEVARIGAILIETNKGIWELTFDKNYKVTKPIIFKTYNDHRMVMALTPLCMKYDIVIENPEIVSKSYLEFWNHLELAGIDYEFDKD